MNQHVSLSQTHSFSHAREFLVFFSFQMCDFNFLIENIFDVRYFPSGEQIFPQDVWLNFLLDFFVPIP